MSVVSRRNAVVIGSLLLLCSLGFGDWEQLTSGTIAQLNGVHFPTGTMIGYAVGSDLDSMGMPAGAIFKTDDGGSTWTAQSSPAASPLNSVYFIDDNTGYAVGDAGAGVMTTDGGANWTSMPVGTPPTTDQLNYVGFPGGGQTGFIGVNPRSQSAKAYLTTDGGATWTPKTVGGAMNWTISCAFADDNIGVVLGRNGFVWGTNDGLGSGWYGGAGTNAELSAAAFARDDANQGILIGNDSLGGIIRSTGDAGVSVWETCRHWRVPYFSGVDIPVAGAAYVCGDSAGQGRILRQVANHPDADFYRTTVPSGTPAIMDVCFPGVQDDTGYAVGNNGCILKTTDKGVPWLPGVAEGKAPVVTRSGIRVVTNPCRHGIMLHADADVKVSVFDAAGREVMSRAAARGTSFLPLPTGAYFVKAGTSTARAVVTD